MRQLHAPVIVRIAFLAPRLAVLLPASALTQDAEITTSCACTGFRDPDTSVLVALPVRALVSYAGEHRLRLYRVLHNRSHLVLYETSLAVGWARLISQARLIVECCNGGRCR